MARKSVDITTLAGWEALSSGTHNITIVAKADGFKDSAPSAAVQVVKVVNWSINITATNCTADASNPNVVPSNTTAENPVVLRFNKVTGYALPTTLVLDGIADDGYTWSVSSDGAVGTITIIDPSGNITGAVAGVWELKELTGTYTWKETIPEATWTEQLVNFALADGTSYKKMYWTDNGTTYNLYYDDMLEGGSETKVYSYDADAQTGTWVDPKYRIVNFTSEDVQYVPANFYNYVIANTTQSAYDYTFDETMGVLTLNKAPHSQSGDALTIL